MTIIWFNGRSADSLLKTLPKQSFELGCNYIELHRPVDVVCAFDIRVVQQITLTPGVEYYTRTDARANSTWSMVTDPALVNGGNSGILACYVARQLTQEPVYILGCDWGLSNHSRFDSVYNEGPKRKYSNNMKRAMKRIFKGTEAYIVHDDTPDVPLPIISVKHFVNELSNK